MTPATHDRDVYNSFLYQEDVDSDSGCLVVLEL